MKKIAIRVISIILLLCTFFVIFNFSSQDGEKSSGLSYKITTGFVNNFFYTKNLNLEIKQKIIEEWHPIVRKLAHLSIYTLVGISMMMLMYTFSAKLRTKFGISLLVGLIYAISDEFHQSFIPRKKCILD